MDIPKPNYPRSVVDVPEFTLVGVLRNIRQKDEVDSNTGQIGKAFEEYFGKQIFSQIPNRQHPMRTYCLYYEYQNAGHFEEITYKMLIGEVVNKVSDIPEGLTAVTVPAHSFCKFDVGPGPIPQVVIEAWKSLCTLTPADFGGKRSHSYDFEVYPETMQDKSNTKFDLYIGITKE